MAKQSKVVPYKGWVLISRDEIDGKKTGNWYVCWHEVFTKKRDALWFAGINNWQRPYKAVRGALGIQL